MTRPLTESPEIAALIDELIAMQGVGITARLRTQAWVEDKSSEQKKTGNYIPHVFEAQLWLDIVTALVRRLREAEERR